MNTTPEQNERRETLRQDLEYLGVPMRESRLDSSALFSAADDMDWQQVILNGGPPCLHLAEDGRFCGRAERWHKDSSSHEFKSFAELLREIREEGGGKYCDNQLGNQPSAVTSDELWALRKRVLELGMGDPWDGKELEVGYVRPHTGAIAAEIAKFDEKIAKIDELHTDVITRQNDCLAVISELATRQASWEDKRDPSPQPAEGSTSPPVEEGQVGIFQDDAPVLNYLLVRCRRCEAEYKPGGWVRGYGANIKGSTEPQQFVKTSAVRYDQCPICLCSNVEEIEPRSGF